MVDGFMGRKGRTELGNGQDSVGGRTVDTQLPVHENQQEGGRGGYPDIRRLKEAVDKSMRVPDGSSTDERAGENSHPSDSNVSGGLLTGSDRDGTDDIGSEDRSLFGIKIAERSELTDVSNRYRGPAEETATGVAEVRLRNGNGILTHPADDYERVFHKAIQKQESILDMELPDEDNEHFGRILSAQQAAATSVINSGLKADENRLRREKKEVLMSLYERFKQTKGTVIEGQVVQK